MAALKNTFSWSFSAAEDFGQGPIEFAHFGRRPHSFRVGRVRDHASVGPLAQEGPKVAFLKVNIRRNPGLLGVKAGHAER